MYLFGLTECGKVALPELNCALTFGNSVARISHSSTFSRLMHHSRGSSGGK